MTKLSNRGRRAAKKKADKSKNAAVPILRVQKGASLKTIYAAARQAFTAADLQKYTVDEPMVPMELFTSRLQIAYLRSSTRAKG